MIHTQISIRCKYQKHLEYRVYSPRMSFLSRIHLSVVNLYKKQFISKITGSFSLWKGCKGGSSSNLSNLWQYLTKRNCEATLLLLRSFFHSQIFQTNWSFKETACKPVSPRLKHISATGPKIKTCKHDSKWKSCRMSPITWMIKCDFFCLFFQIHRTIFHVYSEK